MGWECSPARGELGAQGSHLPWQQNLPVLIPRMFRVPQEIVWGLQENVAHSFMDPEHPLRPATVKDKAPVMSMITL